jgi:hypothetical protein
MNKCGRRVLIRLPGVRDLWHVYKLHERKSGDLGRDCCIVSETVRPGKAKAEYRRVHFREVGQANST